MASTEVELELGGDKMRILMFCSALILTFKIITLKNNFINIR